MPTYAGMNVREVNGKWLDNDDIEIGIVGQLEDDTYIIAGGRKRRGKKSRKSRKGRKGRKGKKSRKNKRTKRR